MAFTPDGTRLYYLSRTTIVERHLRSGSERTIYRPDQSHRVSQIKAANAGDMIAFELATVQPGTGGGVVEPRQWYIASVRDLKSSELRYESHAGIDPWWSPDATYLWFACDCPGDIDPAVIMNVKSRDTFLVADTRHGSGEPTDFFRAWIVI